jgi:hypothetical protein
MNTMNFYTIFFLTAMEVILVGNRCAVQKKTMQFYLHMSIQKIMIFFATEYRLAVCGVQKNPV